MQYQERYTVLASDVWQFGPSGEVLTTSSWLEEVHVSQPMNYLDAIHSVLFVHELIAQIGDG